MDLAGISIKDLLDASVSVVLALIVIYWHRADCQRQITETKQRLQEEKEHTDQERADKLLLMRIVEENTKAITKNTDIATQILNTCERRCSNAPNNRN